MPISAAVKPRPSAQKIVPAASLRELGQKLRARKKKIVFTNGTFDLLHTGHVTYLEKARALGDVLIVGVNSDASVRTYKTPDRPLNPEADRLRVLAALECVDYVALFREPTPLKMIVTVKPHVLAKGADWKKSQIAGAKEVESWGGRVRLVKLVPGRSTTGLLQKMRGR